MNKLTLSLVLFLNVSLLFGQTMLEQRQIGGESFIKPSYETAITLFNQSYEEWASVMTQHGFTLMDDSEGIVTYSKGEIGERIQAIAKNKVGLLSIEWFDFKGKTRLTKEIEDSLKPYFFGKDNNISFYYFKEYIIGIKVHEDDFFLQESIYIKRR